MDAEALCVQSGSWVWRLHVDVSLLDDGGNSIDACVLAAVAALRHYRLPEVNIGGGGGGGENDDDGGNDNAEGYQETTIIHSDDREPTPLPLHHTPLTATFALFADETGTSTAVSALLDPFDREELACDGLLTWSYNKYGEMCCLDFPGGCELRPRQLMGSARLGKRRCVEICELLETALEEAEGKAQKERMERLKNLNLNQQSASEDAEMTTTTAASDYVMDVEPSPPSEDQTDAATRKEEEEYRKRALDYSSGHFAASVKEDKDRKSTTQQGKNTKGETSSLFHAILRSAQTTAGDNTMGVEGEVASIHDFAKGRHYKNEPVVEIIAHDRKSTEPSKYDSAKPQERESMAHSTATLDSDEEEVVQLQTEFSAAEKDREASASPKPQTADSTIPMETDSVANQEEPEPAKISNKGQQSEKKVSSPKSKPANEEDDITDLSQALKKKKKSKKTSKKK